MRNMIISVYQPSHLANLIPTMQKYIKSATQTLTFGNKEEEIIFSNFTLKLTTDIIGKAAFGVDFGLSNDYFKEDSKQYEVAAFIEQHIYSTTTLKMDLSGSFSTMLGLLIPILQEPIRQILKRIPSTMDYKVEKTNSGLSSRLDEIVAKRTNVPKREANDFLSRILSERESKNVFTSDYASATTYEHLLAGSTTTSFKLSSIVYLVSGHLEVEKKLLEEIDEFGPHGLMPTADDLHHKFSYLDQASISTSTC